MLISQDSRRRCFKKWRRFRSQDPRGPVRVAMKTWNLSQAPLHLPVQILLNIPQILMLTCQVRSPHLGQELLTRFFGKMEIWSTHYAEFHSGPSPQNGFFLE